jgi:small subunit ribosomal protein S16
MAVCIRLSRIGRTHRPYFRILAIDKRCHREGKHNEVLGVYDPLLKDKNLQVDVARVEAWVKQGAQVSEAVASLMKHNGYAVPTVKAAKATGPKAERATSEKKSAIGAKGVKQAWAPPSRRARLAHAAKVKAARKAEAAAAKPADAAAEAPKA